MGQLTSHALGLLAQSMYAAIREVKAAIEQRQRREKTTPAKSPAGSLLVHLNDGKNNQSLPWGGVEDRGRHRTLQYKIFPARCVLDQSDRSYEKVGQ